MSRNLLSFFFSNDHCKELLKGTREGPSLFATDCFGCHKAAGFYKEDEWTERLFHCLKLKNIDAGSNSTL